MGDLLNLTYNLQILLVISYDPFGNVTRFGTLSFTGKWKSFTTLAGMYECVAPKSTNKSNYKLAIVAYT